ncbi:MAG: hypothetical protein RR614_09650 [Eubacterium sp.]
MNRTTLLSNISFKLDEEAFFSHIRMQKDSKRSGRILEIIEMAKRYIHPIAMYKRAEIELIDQDVFTIDKISFHSRGIYDILKQKPFVFPNIVSCGPEIEAFCVDRKNVLEQYITMELCNFGCDAAKKAMLADIQMRYNMKEGFDLFPGEKGWELQQGIQIFKIFSKETKKVGLSISSAGIPKPSRTAYGLVVGN